jgi:hypothetical protein
LQFLIFIAWCKKKRERSLLCYSSPLSSYVVKHTLIVVREEHWLGQSYLPTCTSM